jgi:hypothetical protein
VRHHYLYCAPCSRAALRRRARGGVVEAVEVEAHEQVACAQVVEVKPLSQQLRQLILGYIHHSPVRHADDLLTEPFKDSTVHTVFRITQRMRVVHTCAWRSQARKDEQRNMRRTYRRPLSSSLNRS